MACLIFTLRDRGFQASNTFISEQKHSLRNKGVGGNVGAGAKPWRMGLVSIVRGAMIEITWTTPKTGLRYSIVTHE